MLSNKRIVLALIAVLTVGLLATSLTVVASSHGDSEEHLSGKLEIFHWWAGSEGPAINALMDYFKEEHPDVEVINAAVTGGSGINAKAVLKTRLLGGNPPDSFQIHAGRELIGTWVTADRMADLTSLYKEQGWMDKFPQNIIDRVSTEEGMWSVPLTIHRSNVMWYMPDKVDEWGIEVPKTWDEFLEVAPKIEEKGVVPLSMGTNWTARHVWESIALAELGPEMWRAMWDGEASVWTSDEMLESWKTMDEVLQYVNEDASSLSWQQATDMLINGEAAFNIMGDWAAGYMSTVKNLTPKTEFGWAASPGTEGEFMWLSDSFGLPKGAPHRENAMAWLKLVGSQKGSDIFNPKKGSISPRLDSDISKYNEYSQSAAKDFRNDTLVGSMRHGVVANEGFMNDMATVMEQFLKNRNPEQAMMMMEAIAKQNGII
uniref:Sugar ABC transporter, substrate-binding protein n=1 Tax=uncultured organism TaxID=155900 RepID=M1PV06_9ZZZZ|nr:sugar ABC transporter, substrate-binding protein [uncultured organism]